MTNSNKQKGDKAEREAATLLSDLIGLPCRRKLGAGRQDDTGDIDGVPNTTIQVANWKDTSQAAIQKPKGAEQQRINAGERFAMTLVRFKGGTFRVVLTPEQWLAYHQAAQLHTFCQ